MRKTNHKWMIVSVVMHAVLLLGLGSILSPLTTPRPVRLTLDLVPSLPDRLSVRVAPPQDSGRVLKEGPVKMEEEKEQDPAPVQAVPVDKKQLSATPLQVAARKDSPKKVEDANPRVSEPGPKPEDPVRSADAEGRLSQSDPEEKALNNDRTQKIPGDPSDISPSSFPPSADLLAFAGDPGSLDGISGHGKDPESSPPGIISLPQPVYPLRSRRAGEEGRVVIEVGVGPDGRVLTADVIKSSSHLNLDQAALKAAWDAFFRPAAEKGMPIRSAIKVGYRFRLEEK